MGRKADNICRRLLELLGLVVWDLADDAVTTMGELPSKRKL